MEEVRMLWVDDLKTGHHAVERLLKVLRAMATQLESGGSVAEDDIGGALEFQRVFGDECHHAKEDKYLIPALAAVGVPVDSGIVALVLEEHAEGRRRVSEMRKHAAGMSMGDRGAATAGFVAEARAFASLLEAHMVREEGELFPLGEARLDEATQLALADSFVKLESEVLGSGVREAFTLALSSLEETYLSR
jgi:hemerythrin-like domain-containing protein